MLRRVSIGFLSVLLLLTMIGVSCAPPQEPEPADIQLSSVVPLFRGKESITLLPVFSISNPNDLPIGIVSLEYTLHANGQLIGTSQLRNIYVPPKEEVEVKDATVMPFGTLVAEGMMAKGLPQGEAVGAALAIWKTLGGVLPIDALQPKWDAMPDKKPMFEATGTAFLTSEAGEQAIPFQVQWQER